tara:strand:+ start:137 stop:418 length:282 start_codon:yes stop_codon:yes gene_type:complete
MSYDDPTELDYIEVSTGMEQCSLTLIFRDSGDPDAIGMKTPGKITKSFAFTRSMLRSPKEQREELCESFRRFLVACGYPSDYTMEPGYKKDKE